MDELEQMIQNEQAAEIENDNDVWYDIIYEKFTVDTQTLIEHDVFKSYYDKALKMYYLKCFIFDFPSYEYKNLMKLYNKITSNKYKQANSFYLITFMVLVIYTLIKKHYSTLSTNEKENFIIMDETKTDDLVYANAIIKYYLNCEKYYKLGYKIIERKLNKFFKSYFLLDHYNFSKNEEIERFKNDILSHHKYILDAIDDLILTGTPLYYKYYFIVIEGYVLDHVYSFPLSYSTYPNGVLYLYFIVNIRGVGDIDRTNYYIGYDPKYYKYQKRYFLTNRILKKKIKDDLKKTKDEKTHLKK